MDTLLRIKAILRDSLSLGARADTLTADSGLLGSVPEFDSMAVVTVITMIEEEFDFSVDDDELSADVFATVGTLRTFVESKLASR